MSTSILYSALKIPSIKRVIITSSVVTLAPFEWLANPDSERLYTAQDIDNNPSRTATNGFEAYWTSKTLARMAVSKFSQTENPHFEIIQLFPSAIVGPDDRATSITDVYNNTPLFSLRMSPVLGTKQPPAAAMMGATIDVGDVAKAHVDAIKSTVPGNVNYTLSTESPEGIEWDSMIDIAKKYWPERCGSKELPLGGTLPTLKWRVDALETEKAFGWKFLTFEESTKAMIGQYLDLLDAEKSMNGN
jgi:nucleoside-diphosphate-sugar epimerase